MNDYVYKTIYKRTLLKGYSFTDPLARSGAVFDLATEYRDDQLAQPDPDAPLLYVTEHDDAPPGHRPERSIRGATCVTCCRVG